MSSRYGYREIIDVQELAESYDWSEVLTYHIRKTLDALQSRVPNPDFSTLKLDLSFREDLVPAIDITVEVVEK